MCCTGEREKGGGDNPHTRTQARRHASTQAHKHTGTQAHRHTGTQAHRHSRTFIALLAYTAEPFNTNSTDCRYAAAQSLISFVQPSFGWSKGPQVMMPSGGGPVGWYSVDPKGCLHTVQVPVPVTVATWVWVWYG
jgi:hypothetical protein